MSALDELRDEENPKDLGQTILFCEKHKGDFEEEENLYFSIRHAAAQYTELRRLVAILTTEPPHITRADIDAAKRILQKAEE